MRVREFYVHPTAKKEKGAKQIAKEKRRKRNQICSSQLLVNKQAHHRKGKVVRPGLGFGHFGLGYDRLAGRHNSGAALESRHGHGLHD